jgi:3-oxoacyl-[acyl-carrier protein] reductase
MGLLDGKVALITGAGQGLGRGIARRFAREGASLVLAEISQEHVEEAAREIRATTGAKVVALTTDVGDKAQIEHAVHTAEVEFGGLDILVNNASALSPNLLFEHKTDAMLERCLRVGVWAAWWSMRAALPLFQRRGGGRVINFYSIDADTGAWLHADYNVNKAGIQALTRSAAMEWGRFNILCNCLSPAGAGTVWQDFLRTAPDVAAQIEQGNPLGRVGDADDDIAPVAVFLASDLSRYVTGMTLPVDGGQHVPGYNSRPHNLADLEAAGTPSMRRE